MDKAQMVLNKQFPPVFHRSVMVPEYPRKSPVGMKVDEAFGKGLCLSVTQLSGTAPNAAGKVTVWTSISKFSVNSLNVRNCYKRFLTEFYLI
jgi:hypothetical protein